MDRETRLVRPMDLVGLLRALAVAMVLCGCLSPDYTDQTRCGPDSECPSGRSCVDDFCKVGGIEPDPCTIDNKALQFGGTQFAQAPDSTSLRPTSLTIEAWARFTGFPGTFQSIVTKQFGAEKANSFALWYEGGFISGGINVTMVSDAIHAEFAPDSGTWYFFAYVYDAATGDQRLYKNGELLAGGNRAGPIMYDGHPALIGADVDFATPQGFFQGEIDEVRIWSVARTENEIFDDQGSCTKGARSGLAGYWPLDEGGGQTFADSSGNGNGGNLGVDTTNDPRDPSWITSDVPFAD